MDELTKARAEIQRLHGLLKPQAAEIKRLRKVLQTIAEMPASTHTIDAELCRETLSKNQGEKL